VGKVRAEDFLHPVHGRIFERIEATVDAGKRPDAITLKPFFESDPDIAYLGRSKYLAALMESVVAVHNAAHYGPACAQSSRRVHSRYSRQLSDLPWEGIPVRIELRVRRSFCGAEQCGRRVFTERLPNTVKRYGRRSCRLSTALKQITLVLGGSAGSRLAEQLGILTSGSTLLRGLRKKARADAPISPRVVGIDDWACRKGQR
jgi:hypothetical protein